MSDLKKQLEGAALVTANIFYFKPRAEGAGPLEIRPELIGEDPKKIMHTGLIEEFIWQEYDINDLDQKKWERFRELKREFRQAITLPDARERLEIMFNQTAGQDLKDAKLAASLLSGKSNLEDLPFVPDVTKMAPEDTLAVMIPYPKLREFLRFWQDKIDGPLHSVRYTAQNLVKPAEVRTINQFGLH